MKNLKLLILLLLPLGVLADIRLPEIFGNGMVLQQHSEVKIWGWSSPAEKIFIKGSWNNVMDSTITTSGVQVTKRKWAIVWPIGHSHRPITYRGFPSRVLLIKELILKKTG